MSVFKRLYIDEAESDRNFSQPGEGFAVGQEFRVIDRESADNYRELVLPEPLLEAL